MLYTYKRKRVITGGQVRKLNYIPLMDDLSESEKVEELKCWHYVTNFGKTRIKSIQT